MKRLTGKPEALRQRKLSIIEAVGYVRTYGVKKYGENTNWEKVESGRYRAALMRHLCLRDPHGLDEESGLPHLWHMACNIAFLCELERIH